MAKARSGSPDPVPSEKLNGIEPQTLALAFTCLIQQFPNRQLNASELALGTGIGRTAMSRIAQERDSPFSLQKCTAARLNEWLQKHSGFKAN